jgi:hypothetical protein
MHNKCERCNELTRRRVRHTADGKSMLVCKKCKEELSLNSFMRMADGIINNNWGIKRAD